MSARIADLLGRLTLDEKVALMSDHPKIPRLGIVFSGQVEGLHGLALGGPADWGARGRQPAADDDVSAGEGAGRDVGSGAAEEGGGAGGRGSAVLLPEPGVRIVEAWWCGRRMRI